ncbi:MAG: hypothetical protein BWY82_00822 [Verrucomicrobia bacterium ADurb.Bin474]|nr:MAG: hypothetical protein BWY82_00822 [Verrucomicrobia bacterium ADurb.Bin474]
MLPCLNLPTRHETGTKACALLSPGDPTTDKEETFCRQIGLAPNGVGPLGVTAIHNDVTFIEKRNKAINDRIGSSSRLNHDDDLARPDQAPHELLKASEPLQRIAEVSISGHKLCGLRSSTVINRDLEAVIGDVQREILSHHRKADESDV